MPTPWAPLPALNLFALSDILRQALRWALVSLIASGLAWSGGYVFQEVWSESTRAPGQRSPHQDRWVSREAARGIAQLERFLDQQPHN
jgi:hypothetical protein